MIDDLGSFLSIIRSHGGRLIGGIKVLVAGFISLLLHVSLLESNR